MAKSRPYLLVLPTYYINKHIHTQLCRVKTTWDGEQLLPLGLENELSVLIAIYKVHFTRRDLPLTGSFQNL